MSWTKSVIRLSVSSTQIGLFIGRAIQQKKAFFLFNETTQLMIEWECDIS